MDSRKYPCLTVLHTRGSHYDVGYNVGSNYSDNIKQYLLLSKRMNDKIFPFYNTNSGRDFYDLFLKVSQECFPQYVRELRGMSDGSGIPFEDLFLLNISPEIRCELNSGTKPKIEAHGCSDIFLNCPSSKLLVHNEDCDPLVKPFGYMMNAAIDDEEGKERFLAFCYPGFLPGPAFSVNGDGMVVTIDGLYPKSITLGAASRYFVNRSMLRAKDLNDAKRLATNSGYGMAYGFCANIASVHDPTDMWALEISPGHPETKPVLHTVPEGPNEDPSYYFRCNSFLHSEIEEQEYKSSENRMSRSRELPKPKSLQDILNILGDTGNSSYPIFRTPRGTDMSETVVTVSMDILKKRMDIYQGNPKIITSPFMSLPLELY